MEYHLTKARNKVYKTKWSIAKAFSNPGLFTQQWKSFWEDFYVKSTRKQSLLKTATLSELITESVELHLSDFMGRDGNVTTEELIAIASLIRQFQPSVLLELGTFDGNTTLQMALNAPPDATIHTLDLPPNPPRTKEPISKADLKYVLDEKKLDRKYLGSPVEDKVIQYLGDSTNFNFAEFTKKGPIDFAFIDAGHTYECVKSDTRHVFEVTSDKGIILWHDCHPFWNGVYLYLNQLAKIIPLIRIEGTNLAYHRVTPETRKAFLLGY